MSADLYPQRMAPRTVRETARVTKPGTRVDLEVDPKGIVPRRPSQEQSDDGLVDVWRGEWLGISALPYNRLFGHATLRLDDGSIVAVALGNVVGIWEIL